MTQDEMRDEKKEPQKIMSAECNIFFDERGVIGQGGGLHLKITKLGNFDPVTAIDSVLAALGAVNGLREATLKQEVMTEALPQEASQPLPEAPQPAAAPKAGSGIPSVPSCSRKGRWLSEYTAKDGRHFPGRFDKTRKHNDPRMNAQGDLYCPTPIAVDTEGKLLWCTWRASEQPDGSWREWDVTQPEERAES